jgi:hypothetical protein
VAKNSEITFANPSGHELIEKWRTGFQEAAAVLMERYRLRLIAVDCTCRKPA